MYLLKFNFILVLNFIFFCFNIITIHYHTQKQRNMRFKPRVKFNQNISTVNEKSQKKRLKLLFRIGHPCWQLSYENSPLVVVYVTGNDEPYWPLCDWVGDGVEMVAKVHCELFWRTNLPPCGNTSPKCTLKPSRPGLLRNLKAVNSRAIVVIAFSWCHWNTFYVTR